MPDRDESSFLRDFLARAHHSLPLQALGVLIVCGLIYWPFLGFSGFSMSEGLRVLPGWEMADTDNYLVPHLFGQAYLRKPPGMPWAVALSSFLLGQNEFSARAVSAAATTLAALVSLVFATRWFGRPWGFAAGVAYALTPAFWYPGRSAEIEALHHLFVLLAACGLIDLLHSASRQRAPRVLLITAGVGGMMLVKGPAALPVILGVLVAAWLVLAHRTRTRHARVPWAAAVLGVTAGMLLFSLVIGVMYRAAVGEHPILEPPSRFLWRSDQVPQVLLLPLVALATGLPITLALPSAFLPSTRPDPRSRHAAAIARTLALALLISLAIYALIGVSNNRYALPALVLAPLVAAYTLRDWSPARRGVAPRWKTARSLVLGLAPVWAGVLLVGAGAYISWSETRREHRTSGKEAGMALGDLLEDGSEVWAWEMIDHRPEVFWYARERASASGRTVTIRWTPPPGVGPSAELPVPPPGGYLVLRDDDRPRGMYPPEFPQYESAGVLHSLNLVAEGFRVHNFTFRVYRVPDKDRNHLP